MKRELPIINIEGTDFIVDVERFELREKANPLNRINIFDLKDNGSAYTLEYCPQRKNVFIPFVSNKLIYVNVPPLNKLDPIGMAKKYKQTTKAIEGKTDFAIMVNQRLFDLRVNKGVLPTVKIAGHTFYVDLRMDKLRPKDNFLSNGIVFSDIKKYYDEKKGAYIIPYNPKTLEFQEPDSLTIKEFPKDLMAVSFPSERMLDRIGWNRRYGLELTRELAMTGLKMKFTAKNIPWKKTFLADVIEKNLQKIAGKQQPAQSKQSKRKGRRL